MGKLSAAVVSIARPANEHYYVANRTSTPLEVRVSNASGGSRDWFTLLPGQSDFWRRGAHCWEVVVARDPRRRDHHLGCYLQSGSTLVIDAVHEHGFLPPPELAVIEGGATVVPDSLDTTSSMPPLPIETVNASAEPVHVRVSRLNRVRSPSSSTWNSDDEEEEHNDSSSDDDSDSDREGESGSGGGKWILLEPLARHAWTRRDHEMVMVKRSDGRRLGAYVSAGSRVTFRG
ncbi:hypothetical protein BC828DRAFT_387569 [Blastocladiella britannica]|nr:hypothetical protein BC828DRAFT_387569 [Blastocladiella britannica]